MISLQSRRLAPSEMSLRALGKGIEDLKKNISQLLDYPGSKGDSGLREDVKRITPNWHGDVLITNSATQALSSTLSFIGTGKTIAVQVPAYFAIFDQAKKLKQRIVSWETVDQLEKLRNYDAIITTSNHTPPSSVSLTASDKERIANFAKKHSAWVIEDNAYEPLWFNHEPLPIPTDPDRSIRIGSFSKISGPGLRLGFSRATDEILDSIRKAKIADELSTSLAPQLIVSPSLTADNLDNWKETLRTRATLLGKDLEAKTRIEIPKPDGGSYLRLDLPKGCDPHTLAKACEDQDLLIDTNEHQYSDGKPRPYIRLHCGAIDEKDISQAAEILTKSINKVKRT